MWTDTTFIKMLVLICLSGSVGNSSYSFCNVENKFWKNVIIIFTDYGTQKKENPHKHAHFVNKYLGHTFTFFDEYNLFKKKIFIYSIDWMGTV